MEWLTWSKAVWIIVVALCYFGLTVLVGKGLKRCSRDGRSRLLTNDELAAAKTALEGK